MSDVCKCGHIEGTHGKNGCTVIYAGSGCETHVCTCPAFNVDAPERDDLAALLAKHRWISSPFHWTGCGCDRLWWKGYESIKKTEEMYNAHVADVVIASGWSRERVSDG